MAKETFMLRGQVIAAADETRVEAEIDLGSYVNLGISKGTALRVHSVQVQYCDSKGIVPVIDASAGSGGQTRGTFCCSAITTAQVPASFGTEEMPQLDQDYVMFSGNVSGVNPNNDNDQGLLTDAMDLAPQHLQHGYLLAVDTLYLYAVADDAWNESIHVNFLLECSLEKITQATAVSLSLSQT
tara:strand:+ start:54 stop:605 length:552 start_codon:yes stop_codon:yes gene_type:complete